MRSFSYVWSLLVTWQRWRSRHSIRCSHKPHDTRTLHGSIFHRTELWAIKVLHCGNGDFRLFASVTLTLTRWPSHANMTHIPWRYIRCVNMNVLHQGFQELSSDRHKYMKTNRQTNTTKIIYRAALWVVKKTKYKTRVPLKSRKVLTMSLWPASTATCNGVCFVTPSLPSADNTVWMLALAPASSNARTRLTRPRRHATCSAVSPWAQYQQAIANDYTKNTSHYIKQKRINKLSINFATHLLHRRKSSKNEA